MMWRLYARDLPNMPSAHPRSAGIMPAARGIALMATTILVPTILALIIWALLIWALMAIITPMRGHGSEPAALHPRVPDVVELPAGTFRHRAAGEFSRGGKPVTAPMVTAAITRPLAIMR